MKLGRRIMWLKKKNVSILGKYDLFAKLQLKLLPQKLSVKLKQRRMCCIACYELTCTFNSHICQQIDGRRHDFVNAVQFGHFMLQVKPCDICGDGGWPEQIATCYLCKSAREHMYGCYLLPCLLPVCVPIALCCHCLGFVCLVSNAIFIVSSEHHLASLQDQ